jgi:hypothetical protein
MSLTPLEELVKETRHAFIIAKADGVLDAGEVIQIATALVMKIQKLVGLSGSEKKAMLLLTLKKGLDASGGLDSLPGFANTSEETKKVFEDSLMSAVSVSVDMLLSAAAWKLDLRKPASWAACLPVCLSAVKALVPKDHAYLVEATKYTDKVLKKDEEVVVKDVEPVKAVDVIVEPATESEKKDADKPVALPGTTAE